MIDVEFKINYNVYRKRLRNLHQRAIPWFKSGFKNVAKKGLQTIIEATPETSQGRTEIKDLWDLKHTSTTATETFIIENLYPNQKVLMYFEKGTDAHVIEPTRKKFLHFFIDSSEVFTKIVFHPGTPAYKMVEKTRGELDADVDAYVNYFFKSLDRLMGQGVG